VPNLDDVYSEEVYDYSHFDSLNKPEAERVTEPVQEQPGSQTTGNIF